MFSPKLDVMFTVMYVMIICFPYEPWLLQFEMLISEVVLLSWNTLTLGKYIQGIFASKQIDLTCLVEQMDG